MLNLMEWIGKAHDELCAALNPELAGEFAARGELRAAGVAEHSIDALYPLDPFAHTQTVASLLHDIEAISLLHQPLQALDLPKWGAYAPPKMGVAANKQLHILGGVDGSEMYMLAHEGKHSPFLLIRPGSRVKGLDVTEFQRTALKGLLMLPSFLNELSRYPFAAEPWDETLKYMFERHAAIAKPELSKVLDLIRIYNPQPAESRR